MQFCDPARPTTIVHAGPGRERIEFMRLPEETIDQLREPKNVWKLLGEWGLTEDNCQVERIAVYTFHARWYGFLFFFGPSVISYSSSPSSFFLPFFFFLSPPPLSHLQGYYFQ